jgi:hypothetical protein
MYAYQMRLVRYILLIPIEAKGSTSRVLNYTGQLFRVGNQQQLFQE